jgi:hypothetical protein
MSIACYRLLQLRLIVEGRDSIALTISGKKHFDLLPRPFVATKLRQRNAGSLLVNNAT